MEHYHYCARLFADSTRPFFWSSKIRSTKYLCKGKPILSSTHPSFRDESMFADIERLWGNEAYSDFQRHLWPQRPLTLLALRIFARGIKTSGTRFLCIAIATMLHPHLTTFDSTADAIFYGPSRNNDDVLRRVSELLKKDTINQDFASQKASLRDRLRAVRRLGRLRELTLGLASYKDCGTLLSIQLIITASARLYFERRLHHSKARIVVVANDHSPMQVGLRDAAYVCDVRCVYCQHAPISPLYPPLRFDVSLLSNPASLDIYKALGPTTGDIAILPPFLTKPTPIRSDRPIKKVGICLSRVWAREAVSNRIKELCSLPGITAILVRWHPQDQAEPTELAQLDPKVEVTDSGEVLRSFARRCDLVVVPGSGVLVELLHHGTACVYAGDLDELGHDPHGFVASGLVPDCTNTSLATLTADVGTFFDSSWARTYKRFDATADKSLTVLEKEAREAILRLLDRGSRVA